MLTQVFKNEIKEDKLNTLGEYLMTQSQHTPAPWILDDNTKTIRHECNESTTGFNFVSSAYSVVSNGSQREPTKEEVCNAHLIAASPELLEALQTIKNIAEYAPTDIAIFNIAKEAIAKARGEK